MPTDSNGVYTLPGSFFVQNGDTVLPVQHNPPFLDVAAGLTNRIMKDGRTVMTGDLKMGGFKVTGMADGTNPADAVTKDQLDTVEQNLDDEKLDIDGSNIGDATAKATFRGAIEADTTSKTAAYTVVVADRDAVILANATSAAFTVTLPAAATAGNGFTVTVKKIDSSANAVTIDGDGSETIDGAITQLLQYQYDAIKLVCDGSAWLIIDRVTAPVQKFESAEQVISQAGSLSIDAGFGAQPDVVQLWVICKSGEQGYAAGNEALIGTAEWATDSTQSRGAQATWDGTNIAIRFANATNPLVLLHKNTGEIVAITNANWRLIVRAYMFR